MVCQTSQALLHLSRFVVYLTFRYLGPLYLHGAFMSSNPSPSRTLTTSLVLSYGSLLPFAFFFSFSIFPSLCEGTISTKKMTAGVNLVAFCFPWACGVAALLLRKHLGAGHLCVQPPASSSHPCRCFPLRGIISGNGNRYWHKPSCFRWTIHKLNFPEKYPER